MDSAGFEVLSWSLCPSVSVAVAGLQPGPSFPSWPSPSRLWGSESRGRGHMTKHILDFNTRTIYRPSGAWPRSNREVRERV